VKLRKRKLRKRDLEEFLRKALEELGLEGVEVSLYITDDEEIRELNRTYRNKDRPTDVLSFPFGEEVGGVKLLGEIVISQDTALRQAQKLGHSLREEVRRLVVHGLVHLLGYDHEKGLEEERKFRKVEEFLLGRLPSL